MMTNEEFLLDLLRKRRDKAERNIDSTPWLVMKSELIVLARCNAEIARRIPSNDGVLAPAEIKIITLRNVLAEVMEWISNWDPNFIHDSEWPATKEWVDLVLRATKANRNVD